MNEPRQKEPVPVVYPQYLAAAWQEDDEVSLVDLWLMLRRYRRVFWSVFAAVLAAGVAFVLLAYQERHALNTAIQIGTIESGGKIVKLESPESLKGKLTSAIVPAVTAKWLKKNPDLERFKTEVSSPKNSDIVIVRNKVSDAQLAVFTAFQQAVADAVLKDHQQLVALYQSNIRDQLIAARARLQELEDPRTLQMQLDQLKLQFQAAERKLQHLQETEKIIAKGGKEAVLRSMTDEQKQQVFNKRGEVDDRVLQARYEEILLNNRVQQDQQAHAVEETRLKFDEVKLAHQRKVEAQQRTVDSLQSRLDAFNVSRVVSPPVRSVAPAGLSRKLMLVLVVFAAGFAAFVAVLLALFRDKVRERELEEQ